MKTHEATEVGRFFPVIPLIVAVALVALIAACGDNGVGPDPDPDPQDTRISLKRTAWHPSSKPAQLGEEYQRGKLLWHAPRYLYAIDDVWDDTVSYVGQGTVQSFRMIFRPQTVKTDTSLVGGQLQVDTTATDFPSWAGITFPVAYGPDDQTASFEIRARGNGGRMHVEFGRISEDVNGNRFAESEDGIISGSPNGTVEEEEDIGLDALADADESDFYDQNVNPDPNGDNWYYMGDGKCPLPPGECNNIDWDDESIRYEWLNGTEGNINDPSVQGKPDQEVLTSGLATSNSYFSFVIDFESDSFKVPQSNWPPGRHQWWTYRLPINDTMAVDTVVNEAGAPDWNDVTHMRVWFEADPGQTKWDTVEVVDWNFVPLPDGNNTGPDSTVVTIRDYEFARGRVYDLGYAGEFETTDKIVNLVVYEQMRNANDIPEADGVANFMVDPREPNQFQAEGIKGIYVQEVDPSAYTWEDDPDRNQHYVVFNAEKGRALWLGAYMQIQRGNDTITIGDLNYGSTGDSLALRILRHSNPLPSHQSWKLMWRNCYSVQRGVDMDDVRFEVYKGLYGTESSDNNRNYQEFNGQTQSYLEVLGLDQYDRMGRANPDGMIDDRANRYRADWGLVFFPDREPFNSDTSFVNNSGEQTDMLQVKVPYIYQSLPFQNHQQLMDSSQYYLRIVYPF